MKIQNSDHDFIGHYVIYKGQKCLVTGVMRKHQSNRGNFYRLWIIKKNQEIWTKGNACFQNIIKKSAENF